MINQKYYEDIKNFPSQFKSGFEKAKNLAIEKQSFHKIVVCGMGGSSLYVEMLNDYLTSLGSNFTINVNRSYSLPSYVDENTLVILASFSGTTEEVLSCAEETFSRDLKCIVFAAGGKLMELATKKNLPFLTIPAGGQPRLATGYFITGVLHLLIELDIIQDIREDLIQISEKIDSYLDEDRAVHMAESLVRKVPIIYSTDNNAGIAMISKIKFNENSKTQAFYNYFPELNHNEMVGYTNLVMEPCFFFY
jgi:glucose/mannose-6-phosphate isomerase